MYRLIDCITQDHHFGYLSIAVAVCVVGSGLSAILLRRMIIATTLRKAYLLILASIIGGSTIWSTHFLSMLAFDPGADHGFDLERTGVSLVIAAAGLFLANFILAYRPMRRSWLFAGVLFGLTISLMHYVGMSAYIIPGEFQWERQRVIASVIAGAVLSAVAYHRVIFPVTRLCWLGATIAIILAICAMHFTGMTAFTVLWDVTITPPARQISDLTFGVIVAGVTSVLFMVGFVAFSIELILERENSSRLQLAALHDPLTGLPNRSKLTSLVTQMNERLGEDRRAKVAVLTIDLDGFKQINDTHGHATGDAVLSAIAGRLADGVQTNEFISRAGGDEFVAIKWDFRRKEEVAAFAERLHARIVDPIETFNATVRLGASIGIATSVEDGRDAEGLLHKSDLAMYRAKAQPDLHICEFNAEIDRRNSERSTMIQHLREALPQDQFFLVYQLQNSISSFEATGFECLLRWQHPEKGVISPGEFIPIAEETGLICDIGLWVLRTACQEAAQWPETLNIAVNVAPQQLAQPAFADRVADILADTGLAPSRLELELTEASVIDDRDHAFKVMEDLKSIGVRIAMDDFGTGYSSLATLQAFPFDKIKIDRSFISGVHNDEQRAAIVRATLLLGAALKIPVLAEGVEDEFELAFLQAENCSAVQGFLFGQPMSPEDARRLIANGVVSKAS